MLYKFFTQFKSGIMTCNIDYELLYLLCIYMCFHQVIFVPNRINILYQLKLFLVAYFVQQFVKTIKKIDQYFLKSPTAGIRCSLLVRQCQTMLYKVYQLLFSKTPFGFCPVASKASFSMCARSLLSRFDTFSSQ